MKAALRTWQTRSAESYLKGEGFETVLSRGGKRLGANSLQKKLNLMLKNQFVKVGVVPQCC
jgi:hypothetical protein